MMTITKDEEVQKQLTQQALPEPEWLVGFDISQARDYTAAVVVERRYVPTSTLYYGEELGEASWVNVGLRYAVRHIERFPLMMSYSRQVKRLLKLIERVGGDVYLIADATGVGRGVVEMLHQRLHERAGDEDWKEAVDSVTPCYIQITGGTAVTRSPGGLLNVPKRDIVSSSLLLFQDGRLRIAEELDHRETLIRELENFRVKINISTAHDTYEAWRENEHDDLVLALSLACWAAERYLPEYPRIEVPGYITTAGPMPAPVYESEADEREVPPWLRGIPSEAQ